MSRRANQLQVDFQSIKNHSETKSFNIKDLKLEEETIYFKYSNGNSSQVEHFSLIVMDYPDGASALSTKSSKEPTMRTGSIVSIIKMIAKEYDTKHGVKAQKQEESEEEEDEELGDVEEGSDEAMDNSDGAEEGEDWEDDVYQSEVGYQENVELSVETKNYQKLFGEHSLMKRPMPLLETVDVEINVIYADIINTSVCSAWGVDESLPITLKFTFAATYFLDAHDEPKIEMYQSRTGKKSFGLKFQLEAIANKYIKEVWPKRSGVKIRAIDYNPMKKTPSGTVSAQQTDSKKSWFSGVFSSDDVKKEKQREDTKTKSANDGAISSILDMGFSFEQAKNALKVAHGVVEDALNLLLADPGSFSKSGSSQTDVYYDSSDNEFGTKSGKNASKPKIGNVNDIFNSPDKALSSDKKFTVPSTYGFLVMMACYLRERLPSLNDYCVICDQPHVFANGNMLKPAVCSRDLCVFSFQTLGVAGEFVDSIATGAEVVDLLVSFAVIATRSPRKELIFEPFPQIFDPKDPKRVILSPTSKDFNLLTSILTNFPSVEQMSKAKDFSDMKTKMDKAHQYSFPLLQWIISSNRSHIVKIHSDKQIKSMGTSHQYLLLSSPPEKETLFNNMKKQHGSTYAFHGSSSENWHCILRVGLKNASGTKLQVNGAAYGSGIYLSPQAATSFGYCRMYGNGQQAAKGGNANQFLNTENINCIAICEDKDIRKSGTVWVQPNSDYVVTRFFFVYTGIDPGKATSCDTGNQAFVKEIKDSIGHYMTA